MTGSLTATGMARRAVSAGSRNPDAVSCAKARSAPVRKCRSSSRSGSPDPADRPIAPAGQMKIAAATTLGTATLPALAIRLRGSGRCGVAAP